VPRNVVVTGARGFLGQALIRELRSHGVVHAVSRAVVADEDNVRWHVGDLAEPSVVARLLETIAPDEIYHLAAPWESDKTLGDSAFDRAIYETTTNILSVAARMKSNTAVVLAGSAKEYGNVSTGAPLSEAGPATPLTPYAAAKLAVTKRAAVFHDQFGLPVITLRLFPVYGPGMQAQTVIMQAIQAAESGQDLATTDGRQTRDLVFVDDVVCGFLAAARSARLHSGVFNLCSGEATTVRALVEKVYQLTGSTGRPRFGALEHSPAEVWSLHGDPSAAAAHLHWRATTPLETGLRHTIEAYRHQRLPLNSHH
jgi:UDP-glucose 4-epimerase